MKGGAAAEETTLAFRAPILSKRTIPGMLPLISACLSTKKTAGPEEKDATRP